MKMGRINKSFWKEKKVLVTGHTGFKGSWLSIWLRKLGANVIGISLEPKHRFDNFNAAKLDSKIKTVYQDIRNYSETDKIFKKFKPQIVFHLAAQALVGDSYDDPKKTFETNVIGTLNILEAIRHCKSARTGVIITSDKCYKNIEQVWGYKETDRLGGDDPYSGSKGCAEFVINSYIKSFFNKGYPVIASTRAGNVIGGGDWSENRIVPDCFKALYSDKSILIRSPNSTRPWQFVLEPLRGYIMLGEKLYKGEREFSSSWNFGPSLEKAYTVENVTKEIIKNWGKGSLVIKKNTSFHEHGLLQLDCAKAKTYLQWKPLLNFGECIRFTTEWYKYHNKDGDLNKDMYDFSMKQINEYENIEDDRT